MTIRALEEKDLERLKEIHAKFYSEEFSLPDFTKHFIYVFAVVDDNDNLITVAGIRPILEIVAVTDKDKSVKDRHKALSNILIASGHIAKHDSFDEIHAFVQDETWKCQLLRKGFHLTAGQSLVYKV